MYKLHTEIIFKKKISQLQMFLGSEPIISLLAIRRLRRLLVRPQSVPLAAHIARFARLPQERKVRWDY